MHSAPNHQKGPIDKISAPRVGYGCHFKVFHTKDGCQGLGHHQGIKPIILRSKLFLWGSRDMHWVLNQNNIDGIFVHKVMYGRHPKASCTKDK
jgi:hypothetical protein